MCLVLLSDWYLSPAGVTSHWSTTSQACSSDQSPGLWTDGDTEGTERDAHCLFLAFSGVRTPGSCLLSLIYPSSITDVSAVIYELRGAGAGWR